jgi:hypothetical protein
MSRAGNKSGQGGEAEKGGEAKKNLLLWCQSVLNPQGLNPKDFHHSYGCALVPPTHTKCVSALELIHSCAAMVDLNQMVQRPVLQRARQCTEA